MWYFHVAIVCHQWNAGFRKTLAIREQNVELKFYEHYQAADIKRKCRAETMRRKFSVQAYAEGFFNADTRYVQIHVTHAKQQSHVWMVSLPIHHVNRDAIKISLHAHIDVIVYVIRTTIIAAFAQNDVNWAVSIPVALGSVDRIVFLARNPVHGIVVISANAQCHVVPHAIDFHAINVVISPSIVAINALRFVEKFVRRVSFARSAVKKTPQSILSNSNHTKLWIWIKIPLSFYHADTSMRPAF
jgi:hypothetical protein